jgi:hypothetical protein
MRGRPAAHDSIFSGSAPVYADAISVPAWSRIRRKMMVFHDQKITPAPMFTDCPPRNSNLAGFRDSDRINTLDLPDDECLPEITKSIESAMKAEETTSVRQSCAKF